MKEIKPYTKTFIEVQSSSDDENWIRRTTFKIDEVKEATANARLVNERYVRVVKVERKTTVLKPIENTRLHSKQEIADLLAAGTKALAGIPGVSVNEGFLMGFGSSGVSQGPTRVSVSFNYQAIAGRRPAFTKEQADARLAWAHAEEEWVKRKIEGVTPKLKAAGIWYAINRYEIVLTKIG